MVTNSQNQMNTSMKSNNTSGVKGVRWHKAANKWCTQIMKNGKLKHLGYFTEIDDAEAAYLAAAEEYQGQFAYHKRTAQ